MRLRDLLEDLGEESDTDSPPEGINKDVWLCWCAETNRTDMRPDPKDTLYTLRNRQWRRIAV